MAIPIQNGRQISMRQTFSSSEIFFVRFFLAFGLRYGRTYPLLTKDGATNLKWHLKMVFPP
jgi:hypothetical protein